MGHSFLSVILKQVILQGRKPTGMDNGGESQLGGGVDQGRVREVDLVQKTIDIRPGTSATNSPLMDNRLIGTLNNSLFLSFTETQKKTNFGDLITNI
jgi:hypothetical protein